MKKFYISVLIFLLITEEFEIGRHSDHPHEERTEITFSGNNLVEASGYTRCSLFSRGGK